MGNQPPQRAQAEVDPSGTVRVTRELLSDLDGQEVPPAAVTDAERRRFGHAYEELKRRYANLDSLLDAAHSTGYALGTEAAAASMPHSQAGLVHELQENLDRLSAAAESGLMKRSNEMATKMEATERFKTVVACEVEESSLVKCLQNDPAHTLNCHHLVEAYTECAARARQAKFGL